MAQDDPKSEGHDLIGLVGSVVRDAEQLLGQHLELVRSEFQEGLRDVPPAVVALGAGAALVATGGVLGSLMIVHKMHRSTRVPLWGCYGLVGGVLGVLGVGLMTAGARRAAHIRLVPRETIAALREDVQWVKDQVSRPAT